LENQLHKETSLYLQQHASNPVHWQAWGSIALEAAKKLNKPILVSIGYSSCHWCHVMEHECFEDLDVATQMNEDFICIKVDREENPEVDSLYMQAVHIMGLQGGWPLNVFCLPNGKAFYGGTYFPKSNWQQVLSNIANLHKTDPKKLLDYSQKIELGYQTIAENNKPEGQEITITAFTDAVIKRTDAVLGGLYGAPKFPMPILWEVGFSLAHLTGNNAIEKLCINTCTQILNGGIYDQLAGGISRYSVDEFWKVPHFEKMLYDNAQFLGLLAFAYEASTKENFKLASYQTIHFLKAEMRNVNGLYYAALDADTEGEEGKFYVWTIDQLQTLLTTEEFTLATHYFGLKDRAYWEKGNYVLQGNIELDYTNPIFKSLRQKLLQERNLRVKPGLDDKQLISWNALLAINLIKCAAAFKDKDLLLEAEQIYMTIENVSVEMGQFPHHYKKGVKANKALLEDYVFVQQLAIKLYTATAKISYLEKASLLTDTIVAKFQGSEIGIFYTAEEDPLLVARTSDNLDSVQPSANSTLACNAYALFQINGELRYYNLWKDILENYNWSTAPLHHANWYKAHYLQQIPFVSLCGPEALAWKKILDEQYQNRLISFVAINPLAQNMPVDRSVAKVCMAQTCSALIFTVKELTAYLDA